MNRNQRKTTLLSQWSNLNQRLSAKTKGIAVICALTATAMIYYICDNDKDNVQQISIAADAGFEADTVRDAELLRQIEESEQRELARYAKLHKLKAPQKASHAKAPVQQTATAPASTNWLLAMQQPTVWVSPNANAWNDDNFKACFVIHWAPVFARLRDRFGTVISVQFAQCGYESNFYCSKLGKNNQGYGIKASDKRLAKYNLVTAKTAANDDCYANGKKIPCAFNGHTTRWNSALDYADLISQRYNRDRKHTTAAGLAHALQFGTTLKGKERWMSYASMYVTPGMSDSEERKAKQKYVDTILGMIKRNGWEVFDRMSTEEITAWSIAQKAALGAK